MIWSEHFMELEGLRKTSSPAAAAANVLRIPVVLEMINRKRQRVTKDTNPGPVSSDICRFSVDYQFNRINRNHLKRFCRK